MEHPKIEISSFGYKYEQPPDADWIVDVRLLQNPFWIPELRPFDGLNQQVREYVLSDPNADEFCTRVTDLLLWLVEKRNGTDRALRVAFGCTGGRHRSVVVSEEVARRLREAGHSPEVRHRDVGIPDPR